MTVRRIGTIGVVTAALAWASLAAAVPPTRDAAGAGAAVQQQQAARTGRGETTNVTRAAAGPATRPATRPAAPPPVQSQIGQRAIRQSGATAPATQPASTSGDGAGTTAGAPTPPGMDFPRVAGALAIVLTLIFAFRSVLKRTLAPGAAAGPSRAIQLLTRTVLSPKQHLMLVRVGSRLVVVADSGGQMSALTEITDPDEVAALLGQIKDEKLSSAAPSFGGLLGRLRQGMDAGGRSPADDEDAAKPTADDNDGRQAGLLDQDDDPGTRSMRDEVSGLLAKVRMLSQQFKGT